MLHIVYSDELRHIAEMQQIDTVIIEPHRGDILDRFSRPLTEELNDFVTLGINPKRVTKPDELAADLAHFTKYPPEYYLNRLNRPGNYIPLVRKIPPEVADKIEMLNWNLSRQTESRRLYPHNELAGQILGCIDIDNNGIAGFELACDSLLKGVPGWRIFQLDVQGRPHLAPNLAFKPPVDGCDIMLTIDLRIQAIVEEELVPALETHKANNASCIVLDPVGGEIIAMASLPAFNPNQADEKTIPLQKIRPISDVFEPGSVNKIIAASLVLESGLAKPSTIVDCSEGSITICGKPIRDSHRHQRLTFEEAIVYSSNVGTIKLALPLTSAALYNMVRRFGFLEKTGVELQGEMSGFMPPLKNWSGLTKPNLIIGQGIAVTALQMAMAYAVIANNGVLMQPRLIKGHYTPDGTFHERQPVKVRQVISSKTARTVSGFLQQVVEKGTGKRAKVDKVLICGKTGTSQKVNPQGGYFDDRFVASFAGVFPADAPKYVIYVVVDDPRREEHQGADVAAPIFQRIATRIIDLNPALKLEKKSKNSKKYDKYVILPNLKSKLYSAVQDDLTRAGLVLQTSGTGEFVIDHLPKAGTKMKSGSIVELVLGPGQRNIRGGVVVPLLVGLSLRDAVLKASQAGLTVQVRGSGKIVSQNPPSGSRAAWGNVCILTAEG